MGTETFHIVIMAVVTHWPPVRTKTAQLKLVNLIACKCTSVKLKKKTIQGQRSGNSRFDSNYYSVPSVLGKGQVLQV